MPLVCINFVHFGDVFFHYEVAGDLATVSQGACGFAVVCLLSSETFGSAGIAESS